MSDLFELAAETQLRKRLRSFQPIDERTAISRSLITCSDYQLFLNQMSARGVDCRPDHWDLNRFPQGASTQPVLGIRSDDAARFCEWLSQRSHSLLGYRYRLPYTHEVKLAPLNLDNFGYWSLQDNGSYIISEINETLLERYKNIVLSHINTNEVKEAFPSLLKSLSTLFGHANINLCEISLDFPEHGDIRNLLLCLDLDSITILAAEVLQFLSIFQQRFFSHCYAVHQTYNFAQYSAKKRVLEARLARVSAKSKAISTSKISSLLNDLDSFPKYASYSDDEKKQVKSAINNVFSITISQVIELTNLIRHNLLDNLFSRNCVIESAYFGLSNSLDSFISVLEDVVENIDDRTYASSFTQPANSLLLVSIIFSLLSDNSSQKLTSSQLNAVISATFVNQETRNIFAKMSNKAVLCYVFMRAIELRRQKVLLPLEGIRLVREIVPD